MHINTLGESINSNKKVVQNNIQLHQSVIPHIQHQQHQERNILEVNM